MSLFNLLHQSVVLKFTESAKPQYDPAFGYVFRLVGVDGMGFLQLQDLQPGANDEHEVLSEPYWINKDIVREIHEYTSALGKDELKYTGVIAKPSAAKSAAAAFQNIAPKPSRKPKAKPAVL
jgi:hypothetical protein